MIPGKHNNVERGTGDSGMEYNSDTHSMECPKCGHGMMEISYGGDLVIVDGPLADVHDESLRDLHYVAPAESLPEVWMALRGSLRRELEGVSLAQLVAGDLPADVAGLAAEYRADTAMRHPT